MAKLDDLLTEIRKEIENSRAQVTANSTQLRAIQSTHDDTKKQLDQSQKDLIAARSEIVNAQLEAKRLTDEAQQQAAEIRGAADAAAKDMIDKAEGKAKAIIDNAEKEAAKIMTELARTRQQLVTEVTQLRSDHNKLNSDISRLKGQAKQFAEG